MGMIQDELRGVTTMAQLAELWNFNAVAVKALPEAMKAHVISEKDAAKERLKRV